MTKTSIGKIFGFGSTAEVTAADLQAQADLEALQALQRMPDIIPQAQQALVDVESAMHRLRSAAPTTQEQARG